MFLLIRKGVYSIKQHGLGDFDKEIKIIEDQF